jgi:hypothetical protein
MRRPDWAPRSCVCWTKVGLWPLSVRPRVLATARRVSPRCLGVGVVWIVGDREVWYLADELSSFERGVPVTTRPALLSSRSRVGELEPWSDVVELPGPLAAAAAQSCVWTCCVVGTAERQQHGRGLQKQPTRLVAVRW